MTFLDSCHVGEAFFESEKIEMFVIVGAYFHENDYDFEEIKPQILTCSLILRAVLRVAFQSHLFFQHEWNRNPVLFTASEKINPLL